MYSPRTTRTKFLRAVVMCGREGELFRSSTSGVFGGDSKSEFRSGVRSEDRTSSEGGETVMATAQRANMPLRKVKEGYEVATETIVGERFLSRALSGV
jgi:hypothetical protein